MNPRSAQAARAAAFEHAREIGFDLVGIAPFGPPPDAERFASWLSAGRHGSMAYLERGRGATLDPRTQWPRGKSLLVVGLGHSRAPIELAGGGRIARYSAGRDYHNVVGKMLVKLRKRLLQDDLCSPASLFVDATPLLERSHASAAGIGFASKAGNLLHPTFGPWFFLGEIILEIDLEPTPAQVPAGSCGTCTACIDACPTDAIVGPGEVDARRCISYATIERKGLVAHELREATGPWAFGCDVCSEVCPWGHKAPDVSERFGSRETWDDERDHGALVEMLAASDPTEDAHRERYLGSPLRRPGREGLARNAAVALGNLPSDVGREALLVALRDDHSPTVRAAAAWGLSRGHVLDAGIKSALDAAAARETDAVARNDMERSRERASG
ncbi:MAG: tRNA epoxyqueuosine(34) reductase QueG [Planctomycetota bacterium]